MRVDTDLDGSLELRAVSLLIAETLQHLPEYLESDDPAVRERWFPRTYQVDEDEQHWRRYAGDDLEHLFASNVELVRKDLAGMEPEAHGTTHVHGTEFGVAPASYRLRIPAAHKTAWQSALNGASNAIFLTAGLEAEDMEREPGSLGDQPKDLALLRLHLLSYVLSLLLEAEGYSYDPELTEEDPTGSD